MKDMSILIVADHDNATLKSATLHAVTAALKFCLFRFQAVNVFGDRFHDDDAIGLYRRSLLEFIEVYRNFLKGKLSKRNLAQALTVRASAVFFVA